MRGAGAVRAAIALAICAGGATARAQSRSERDIPAHHHGRGVLHASGFCTLHTRRCSARHAGIAAVHHPVSGERGGDAAGAGVTIRPTQNLAKGPPAKRETTSHKRLYNNVLWGWSGRENGSHPIPNTLL